MRKQAEGYALMVYRCAQGHEETIWNSRDLVTPFLVDCRICGGEAQHVNWRQDLYAPHHKPKRGDRIFVNLTMERALADRKPLVERYWNDPEYPMSERWPTKEAAVEELAKADYASFGEGTTPDLIVVEADWR